MIVKNYLTNKNSGDYFYFVPNCYWGGSLFYLLLLWVFVWVIFLRGEDVFILQGFLFTVQRVAEDCICNHQRYNKKKSTWHISDHICSLKDKTMQNSLSAAVSCHECWWRPEIQQHACCNPKKLHFVLFGSFFKYSLSLTSLSGLCHIKIDMKHLRDDPDQRHPDFSP